MTALTEQQLAELERDASAATAGPWAAEPCAGANIVSALSEQGFTPVVETASNADAAFIIAAREAVPALIADLRDARALAEQAVAARAVKVGARTVVVVFAGEAGPCAVADQLEELVKERDEARAEALALRNALIRVVGFVYLEHARREDGVCWASCPGCAIEKAKAVLDA